jgi:peptidoglycan/xylan/chitin deacetylase (PgdA/CDA1 family)
MSRRDAAAIWRDPRPDWQKRLTAGVRQAAAEGTGSTRIFFRADDVGVPGERFREMIAIFVRHALPLNLAVVPAWLTTQRWRSLVRIGRAAPRLWCWHQHGWRHHNHERRGKKQEFGPSRPDHDLRADLDRGRRRLEALLGDQFFPVFTPPWNRCSAAVLAYLHRAGYRAVSRSRNSRPPCPSNLRDLAVDIDLHTRKDVDARAGWGALGNELTSGLTRRTCGFMLHHQRMNSSSLAGLDILLGLLKQSNRFVFEDFRSLCRR